MAIPIIINPAANSTKAAAQMERIRQLQPAPEIHVTEGVGNARDIAARLAAEGRPIVVAAGGDGTVNEVVNGLASHHLTLADASKHTALGILPVGTMNVMAYEMGLPGRNLEACWEVIQSGTTREIDLWQANDQYFAQLAGVGFDAEIVQQTPWEMKRRFGPLSYVMTAARILGQEAPVLSVEIEGRPPLFGSVVLLGNGRHYGGPVRVFRDASNTDGLLDVLILHQRRPLEAFQFLAALVATGYQECNDIDYLQVKSLKVTSEQVVPYELDGELGQNTPVEIKLAPFKLKVRTGV
ncbi:diacylglycerol kinase family protein [Verrucomicrobium sp. BvORR106]|uniref:diacylglycerol/lipid kinase family protein n=1 Tax=Verrucomicrobium sp. BvORR106 TaxID=1403819 RepID=UPI00068F09ED|nr:diacylglycerol kinase family protein [Verrucomicrobium sp. BvORR106]